MSVHLLSDYMWARDHHILYNPKDECIRYNGWFYSFITCFHISFNVVEWWQVAALGSLQEFLHLAHLGVTKLLEDAVQILTLCLPEVDLDHGARVKPLKEWLSRVPLEHISDLMGPVDDHRLDGVNQAAIVGVVPVKGKQWSMNACLQWFFFFFFHWSTSL